MSTYITGWSLAGTRLTLYRHDGNHTSIDLGWLMNGDIVAVERIEDTDVVRMTRVDALPLEIDLGWLVNSEVTGLARVSATNTVRLTTDSGNFDVDLGWLSDKGLVSIARVGSTDTMRLTRVDSTALDIDLTWLQSKGVSSLVLVGDSLRLTLQDGTLTSIDLSVLRNTDIVAASYSYPTLTLTKTNGSTVTVAIASASVFAAYYSASTGVSTTTSTSYTNKLTFTTPSLPAGTYLVEYSGLVTNAGLFASQVRFRLNSTTLAEQNLSGTTKNNVGIRQVEVLSGVNTLYVDYSTGALGTASISNVLITLLRIA